MRLLITGGTGFIGNHLCNLLAERGHSLVALVRTPAKARGLPEGAEILRGDLSLFADSDVELPEVDVIVHCNASSSSTSRSTCWTHLGTIGLGCRILPQNLPPLIDSLTPPTAAHSPERRRAITSPITSRPKRSEARKRRTKRRQ